MKRKTVWALTIALAMLLPTKLVALAQSHEPLILTTSAQAPIMAVQASPGLTVTATPGVVTDEAAKQAQGHYEKGMAALDEADKTGDYTRAIVEFDKAIELDPYEAV